MDIRHKLGQLIMMDFRYWGIDSMFNRIPFTKVTTEVCELFKKYNFGGFILFKENVETAEQTISLLRDLQQQIDTPILFGIDQEGGRVNRIKFGTSTCGNMAVAATKNTHNAKVCAEVIGAELYSLGINLNFAPVVDINSNPNNPIIGVRAYSDKPEFVTDMAKASIEGYKSTNIIPCIKHFPGHGDTALDTHLGLVNINKTIKELNQTELYPFAKLCHDVDMIMTAHISIPELDNTKIKGSNSCIPASLSYKITTELLKEKWGYKGLIITDAMDMKAISSNFNQVDAIKRIIMAGTDIAMMPARVWTDEHIYKLEEIFTSLEQEYKNNKAFALRIDESYNKIIEYKNRKNLKQNPIFTLSKDKQITLANEIIASKKHQKLELDIAKQSVTIVKNNGLLPYTLIDGINILIIDRDNSRLEAFFRHTTQLTDKLGIKLRVKANNILDAEVNEHIEQADLVIIVSESLRQHCDIYSHINNLASGKSINIAALTPYDINYMDNVENYVCIYGATSMDQTNYTETILEINIFAGLMTLFRTKSNLLNKSVKIGTLPVKI